MRKLVIGAGLLFLLPLGLMAQEYGPPKVELFTGFSYLRFQKTNLFGGDASLNAVINKNLGLVVDASGFYGSNSTNANGIVSSTDSHIYSILAGPRVSDARGRFVPFAQALFGFARLNQTTTASSTAQGVFLSATNDTNGFGMTVGGGMDIILSHFVALRIIDADYMLYRTNGQKSQGARISAGVVFRFGQKQ